MYLDTTNKTVLNGLACGNRQQLVGWPLLSTFPMSIFTYAAREEKEGRFLLVAIDIHIKAASGAPRSPP